MADTVLDQEITARSSEVTNGDFKPLKAHFVKTKELSGRTVKRLQKISSGSIVRLFEHTPYPQDGNDVVCPHFLELKWAYGCPYDCAWCFLKGTLRMLPEKTAPRTKDRNKVERHVRSALLQTERPELFNSGEICDSLMDERNGGTPFSQWVLNIFEGQSRHKILFLTKSSYVDRMLEVDSHEKAVASFSLNAYKVARKWEKAPTPRFRIKAGMKLSEKDWEVRIRIDPIVPISGWKQEYARLVEDIFSFYSPSRITLGTPRGLQSTLNNVTDKSWVDYLDNTRSGWGRKIEDSLREEIYRFMLDELESHISTKKIGLCKETVSMYRALDRDYRKQVCNCML